MALASHLLLCLSCARFVDASLHEWVSRSLTVESDLLFVGVLSGFLALAVGPFFLLLCLLAAILSNCASLAELNCRFKHEWIRFLELEQHFLAVLGLSKTTRELLDRLEHLEFKLRVGHNSNGLL